MSLVQQLNLVDISDPEPISQLPAIGWWLVAGLTLLALLVAGYFVRRVLYRRKRLKRTLRALEQSWQDYQNNPGGHHIQGEFNTILKRHLIQAGISNVTPLQGKKWRDFLRQHLPAEHYQDIDDFVAQLYRPSKLSGNQNQLSSYQQMQRWLRLLPC